jgi:ribosomal protein S27E
MCPDCNKNPLKFFHGRWTLRCLVCSRLYHAKIHAAKKKEKNSMGDNVKSVCRGCNKEYFMKYRDQKYCHSPCDLQYLSIKNSNKYWVEA